MSGSDPAVDWRAPELTVIDGPVAGTPPRSYARERSYVRVADSSSTPSKEGAPATRRWTATETRHRVTGGPTFRFPAPDAALLEELVRGYTQITGDPVRRPPKRNLIAACYRVHGDAFLGLVLRRFTETRSVTNLLGEIRCLAPLKSTEPRPQVEPAETTADDRHEDVPGLTYGPANRPAFDPTSTRRYDRRPSNPVASGFFEDEDLGTRPHRSPTAEALSR
jgi:hypothetical protein